MTKATMRRINAKKMTRW